MIFIDLVWRLFLFIIKTEINFKKNCFDTKINALFIFSFFYFKVDIDEMETKNIFFLLLIHKKVK